MITISEIIRELERCAAQNEKDAKNSAGWAHVDCAMAMSVAAEQRRMIKILKEFQEQAECAALDTMEDDR